MYQKLYYVIFLVVKRVLIEAINEILNNRHTNILRTVIKSMTF